MNKFGPKLALAWYAQVNQLNVAIDTQLQFDNISLSCTAPDKELSVIARIKYYSPFHRQMTLIKAFFELQFKHCSLTWYFTTKQVIIRLICYIKEPSGWSVMIKLYHLKNFKMIVLMILTFSHLPLVSLQLCCNRIRKSEEKTVNQKTK